MGETGEKDERLPKDRKRGVRGGKKFRQHATPGSRYKGPTSGLEEYIYQSGAAKHAAQFTETTEKLCNYMQANYKSGADIAGALKQLTELVITMPIPPTGSTDSAGNPIPPTAAEEHIFKRKFDAEYTREQRYEENKAKAYALLYEHCAPELKALLKGDDNWGTLEARQDSIGLLRMIKGLCCKFDPTKQETRAIVAADKAIMCYVQDGHVSNSQYFERFNALVDTALSYGSSIGHSRALVGAELVKMGTTRDSATPSQTNEAMELAQERYLSMLMLDGANYYKFKGLREELDNDYAKGTDTYPTNRNAVLRLLNSRKTPSFPPQPNVRQGDAAMMFAQGDGGRPDNRKCFRCGRKGHIATNCPAEKPGVNDGGNGGEEDEHMHTMRAVESDESGEDEDESDDGSIDVDGDDEACYFFHQREGGGLNRNWLLLDSQSSTDMFCNRNYLTNVTAAPRPTTIHCNAGSTVCTKMGIFSTEEFGDIPVKYHPKGICNVISLKTMKSLFPITYSSTPGNDKEATFKVETRKGIIEFKPCSKGLHYFDMNKLTDKEELFVQTVQQSYEGFSKEQVKRAIKARKLQAMLGSPAKGDFEAMVRGKLIDDCPVDVSDLQNAHTIFGPDLAGLRGRTVRRRPERVTTNIVSIPRDFVLLHKFVTLTADIMFVNGVPFLVTRSRNIQLITVEFLRRRTAKIIGDKLTRVLHLYQRAGFTIQTALMDKEFDSVAHQCPTLPINTTAANEHVPEIERAIRLIKERARGIENTLPFSGMPKLMTIELIHFIVLWLNNFPIKSGVSSKYSPRELICRHKLNARIHCKTPFGAYCEVHDEPTPSNSMTPRTHETICMGPTGNIQGSYKFYCLRTKKKLTRRKWDELPMPTSIIRRVDRHAKRDKALAKLAFSDRNNRPYEDIRNEEYDEEPEGLVEPETSPFPDIPSELPGIELAEHAEHTPAVTLPDEQAEVALQARLAAENAGLDREMAGDEGPHLVEADPEELDDEGSIIEIGAGIPYEPQEIIDVDGVDTPILQNEGAAFSDGESSDPEGDEPNEEEIELGGNDHIGELSNEPQGGLLNPATTVHEGDHSEGEEDSDVEDDENRPRRSRRKRKVSSRLDGFEHNIFAMYGDEKAEERIDEYMHATLSEDVCEQIDSYLVPVFEFVITQYSLKAGLKKAKGKDKMGIRKLMHEHLMTQYSLKKGLMVFGEEGEKAVTKELGQFHDMSVFIPMDPTKLTKEERAAALASLIFLKQKKDGTVKARTCADGRKQRETTAEEDAASPTVSIESIFMSCAIEAGEGRSVSVIDLPGAFLHADCPDHVIMRFQGRLAELMVLAAPQIYRKYITTDAKGEPVLFVKLQKAIYGMLKSALLFYKKLLTDLVAKGFTINPYDPCVVMKNIRGKQMTICWHVDDLKLSHKKKVEVKRIENWLRSLYGNISVSEGDKHTYLGMDLDYSEKGKCKISMAGYTKEIIDSFPEAIQGTSATPAADHLFQTRDTGRKLPEEQAAAFHRTTAQLLFLSGRARRDIQTAVAFLTTRVKGPDEDDWGKLKRVLKYLNGTLDLGLCLSVENLGIVRWYVDASYATHEDCRGHTGAMMTLGKGAAISFSRKQKTNARSSTEAELIGMYDALPSVLHARYFLEAMGYKVNQNIIYQDNKSSITLEKNGRTSGSKRTKHIKVRYFFIKDMVEQGEVEIQHCPTKEMWSDVLTKPKQGKEFLEMRAKLLGHDLVMGTARSRTDSKGCSVTPRTDSASSPRGCVGPEVPVRNGKTGNKQQLHVEKNRRRREPGLTEPGRRILAGMQRGIRATAE